LIWVCHYLYHVLSGVFASSGTEILETGIVLAVVIPEGVTFMAIILPFFFEASPWDAFLAVIPLFIVRGEAAIALHFIYFHILPLGYFP